MTAKTDFTVVKGHSLFFLPVCMAKTFATSVQAELLPWPGFVPSLVLLQAEPQTRPEAKNLNPTSTSNLLPTVLG